MLAIFPSYCWLPASRRPPPWPGPIFVYSGRSRPGRRSGRSPAPRSPAGRSYGPARSTAATSTRPANCAGTTRAPGSTWVGIASAPGGVFGHGCRRRRPDLGAGPGAGDGRERSSGRTTGTADCNGSRRPRARRLRPGSVLVASGGDQVRAIEAASGRVRWSVTAEGDSGTSAPVLAGDQVLRAGATDGGFVLTALDQRTGAVRWRADGSGTEVVVGAPATRRSPSVPAARARSPWPPASGGGARSRRPGRRPRPAARSSWSRTAT